MATKEEKAQFAELKKKAKKLKIDFDKSTTVDELQILVDAAESAAQAQTEKAAADAAAGAADSAPAPTGTEEQPMSQAPAVVTDPQGDRIINTHITRGGDQHILVQRGGRFVVKNQFGVVNATFDGLAEAQHHMENLSRF